MPQRYARPKKSTYGTAIHLDVGTIQLLVVFASKVAGNESAVHSSGKHLQQAER